MVLSNLSNTIFQLHKIVRWTKDNGLNNTSEVPGAETQLDRVKNKSSKYNFLFLGLVTARAQ